MKQNLTYTGAGVGIVLFALFGILPGSFLGGVVGLNIAGALMGTPVDAGVVQRIITAVAMLAGVLTSGLMYITASSSVGWVLGAALESVGVGRTESPTKA